MRLPIVQKIDRIFILWVLCLTLSVPGALQADSAKGRFHALQSRLAADGFDAQTLSRLYQSEEIEFDVQTVSRFFRHWEGSLNYDQFLSEKNLRKARDYIAAHEAAFLAAEKKYGVDRQVIAGIVLVETRLGRFLGGPSVLNTLSTMAALDDPIVRKYFWDRISKDRRMSRKHFEKKADRKSGWAYTELKAFLTYTSREKLDPHAIIGSYAGAHGICQFMPSSVMAYAQDGNGDGRIDLFDHADAIASIAGYLKHFGWKPGIEKKKAYKAVWYYNRSSYYVNTVLKVAELLKG